MYLFEKYDLQILLAIRGTCKIDKQIYLQVMEVV